VADSSYYHPVRPSNRVYYNACPVHVADPWDLDPFRAPAIKYLLRAGRKPGAAFADDIRKAIVLLEMLLVERGG
jgi:hypothetical protein